MFLTSKVASDLYNNKSKQMVKYIKYIIIMATLLLAMQSCNESDSVGETQIDTTAPQLNELDIWLRENFVESFNIDIRYKWNINNTDVERFLYPPFQSNVRPMAEVLQKAWIEPYNAVGGQFFISKIAPRQFTLAGGFNFNPNSPTVTLGLAEQGTTITLFNVDFLDFTDINSIREPLKTVQHEYGHILNQNVPIDPAYGQINPQDYDTGWFNRTEDEARDLGYITAYASSQASEDFVEMVSEMLTHSRAEFDAIIEGIENDQAQAVIRQKEALVVEYYRTQFNIDIYELQRLMDEATRALVN